MTTCGKYALILQLNYIFTPSALSSFSYFVPIESAEAGLYKSSFAPATEGALSSEIPSRDTAGREHLSIPPARQGHSPSDASFPLTSSFFTPSAEKNIHIFRMFEATQPWYGDGIIPPHCTL